MAGTVEREWTWTPTCRRGGSLEEGVRIYVWDNDETVVIDQTTNAQGTIAEQTLFEVIYSITGTTTIAQNDETPHRIRALEYGIEVFSIDKSFVAPSVDTFFLATQANITQATKATVAGYTGFAVNHTTDVVTLTAGTTTDTSRLYDRLQVEAVDTPQFDVAEIMPTVDGSSFQFFYDLVFDGLSFDGQGATLTMQGSSAVTFQGTSFEIQDLAIVGNLIVDNPGESFANVDVSSGTVDFSTAGTYTFSNSDLTEVTNSSGGNVTLVLTGSSATPINTGPNITIENPVTITLTGLVAGSEVRAYLGTITNAAAATEIDGIENTPGTTFSFQSNDAGSAGYIVVLALGFEIEVITLNPIPASDTTLPVQQRTDRNFSNPA